MEIVVKINTKKNPSITQRTLLKSLVKQNEGKRIFKVEYSSETKTYQLIGVCFKDCKKGKAFKKIFFECFPETNPSRKEEEAFWRDYNLMKCIDRKKCNRKS